MASYELCLAFLCSNSVVFKLCWFVVVCVLEFFGLLASSIINQEVFLLLNYRIQQIACGVCFVPFSRHSSETDGVPNSLSHPGLYSAMGQFEIIGKCSERVVKKHKTNGCSLSGCSLSICILFLYSENMVRGLDEDETHFLDEVSRQQELLEKQRREEELKELNEYRISFALKWLVVVQTRIRDWAVVLFCH